MIATNDIKALPSNSWDLLDHHHGGWAAANLFSLRKDLTEQGDRWYTIKPINGPHVSWQLAVSSARTALHCFREIYETGTIREVVALFICMGIPFQTLQVTSVLSQPEMRYRAIPLAWRLSGDHRPAREYAEYERVLREFLRRPYARAALLRGGIVWRLAMNEFGLDDAIELAMLGPSRDACEHGFTLSFPGQCHLHDDSITDAEADLICGTYKQSTSRLAMHFLFLLSLIVAQVTRIKYSSTPGGPNKQIFFSRDFGSVIGPVNVKTGFWDANANFELGVGK